MDFEQDGFCQISMTDMLTDHLLTCPISSRVDGRRDIGAAGSRLPRYDKRAYIFHGTGTVTAI